MPTPVSPDILPLPPDNEYGSLSYWQHQIEDSEAKRKDYKEKEWDKNVQSYQGKTLDIAPEHDTVTVPKDFSNVERKKAELFFQNPDISLAPKMPGLEDAVSVFQAVLNHKLGPNGVDAAAMMVECTFDACMTALMVSKIGYESFSDGEQPIDTGEQREVTPAQPMPGSVLGLQDGVPAQMEPVTQMMPNIVHDRCFWQRISPAEWLCPTSFHGFNYDQAPWMGFGFEDDWDILKRRYKLPDDLDVKVGTTETHKLKSEPEHTRAVDIKRVRGAEIWYKASLYDPAVVHPEHLRQLVLIDGLDEPVVHRDSPYQDIVQSQVHGMRGFPVHVGALRYVSDTAFPVPETTVGRPQVRELSKGRTQMLLQRDRNVPWRWVDPGRIGGEPTMEKLRRNVWQAMIPIAGADANNLPIGEIPRSSYPPEDFTFNQIIERDLNETWAFGPNQRGQEAGGRTTATETRTIQANVSSRLDY